MSDMPSDQNHALFAGLLSNAPRQVDQPLIDPLDGRVDSPGELRHLARILQPCGKRRLDLYFVPVTVQRFEAILDRAEVVIRFGAIGKGDQLVVRIGICGRIQRPTLWSPWVPPGCGSDEATLRQARRRCWQAIDLCR